jgi:hypothetical protein
VAFIVTHLRGPALIWWKAIDQETKNKTKSFVDFSKHIEKRFLPLAESRVSRSDLYNIQQHTSVSDYATLFITLLQQAGTVDEETQLYFFKRGLQDKIRKQLTRHRFTNLTELMQVAREIEADFTANKSIRFPHTIPSHTSPSYHNSNHMDIEHVNARSYYEEEKSTSNEINNIQPKRPKKLTPEERETCRREGKCFRCREKGHLAAACTKFPKKLSNQ